MKRKITLIVLGVMMLICALISVSYAYYTITYKGDYQLSTGVNIPECASVTLTGGTAINLSGDSAAPITDKKALSSENYRYEFTVTNACSSASNLKIAIAPSTDSDMPIEAIKYVLVEQGASVPSAGEYLTSSTTKRLTNQIIKEVYAQSQTSVNIGYEILNSSLNANSSKSYYLYIWIDYYEGDTTQSGQNNNVTMNTSFNGLLVVSDYAENEGGSVPTDFAFTVSTNGVANTLPTAGGYEATINCNGASASFNNKYQRIEITSLQSKYADCNINYVAKTNQYTLLKDEVESKTSNNNGYRYKGKEPNNWIWFNNEMYRIIGSVPTCIDATIASGANTGTCAENGRTNLVKIIRADSIGGLVYHSSNTSTMWGDGNTLYSLLNSYYDGKGKKNGSSPCIGTGTAFALCDYSLIGISNSPSDYYGKMVKEVHMNAGAVSTNSVTIDAAYGEEILIVTKPTRIGLMTASDYGYATDVAAKGSSYTYSSVGLSSLSDYEEYNWLYGQNYEWTMTPSGTNVIYVRHDGYVIASSASSGYAIRPVLYLDSSVYIIGGTGTVTNPYIIGM